MVNHRHLWFVCATTMLLWIGVGMVAQTPSRPTFEVASIKPDTSGNRGGPNGFQAGQFRATNLPLRTLIGFAYGDPNSPNTPIRLVGGPSWLDSDRFDIVAKPEATFPPAPIAQQQLMLRSLLAERFSLVVHVETRELPIYELVLARADGRLGPQLHKSDVDCVALRASQRDGGIRSPALLTPGSPPPACDLFATFGRMAGSGTSVDQLTGLLTRLVDRTVVNKTGLAGNYDFELTFTPDQPAPPPGSPLLPPGFDPNGPPIFTALQEQLGLKLEAARGPVDVVVIDRVEHPTAN